MGIKRPDQISASEWRRGGETVFDMYRRRWELIATFRKCGVVMLVDLRIPIKMLGPGFSLWNKHPRCRRIVHVGPCGGWIDFAFKAPGMTQHKPLAAPDRDTEEPGWAQRRLAEVAAQRKAESDGA